MCMSVCVCRWCKACHLICSALRRGVSRCSQSLVIRKRGCRQPSLSPCDPESGLFLLFVRLLRPRKRTQWKERTCLYPGLEEKVRARERKVRPDSKESAIDRESGEEIAFPFDAAQHTNSNLFSRLLPASHVSRGKECLTTGLTGDTRPHPTLPLTPVS